jgi:hypothetical protein
MKMKAKSKFHVAMDGIFLGDHLISFTPDRTRHGIYVGKCRVISIKSGIVSSESLEEFSSGEPLHTYLIKSDFTAGEIVRRAESQIGAAIAPWDDQYFCRWCLRGLLLAPQN